MPYKAKGKCVYKKNKDGSLGEKVGCTDGPVKKYLAALYASEDERKNEGRDPKKGTGKKPKGSGRRLYTDENPKDTVRIKFATPADARATVAKVKRVNKPFARKIQILTVMEQRAKVMGKNEVVRIAKAGKESIRRKKK